ncbi:MAG: hypothetical protein SOU19_02695 [Candidatus Caccosoma sp.]|nr:hypothetical protein [Candidatus Caccosoma sp.]
MLTLQIWDKNSYENSFLDKIKAIVKATSLNIYCGFDYGFFDGFEIFYGTNKDSTIANKVYNELKNKKLNIKICSNIPYDFDLILLFGYTNNKTQRKYLKRKEKDIIKALRRCFN